MPKESDDLVMLVVTFDSNMTFEMHLNSLGFQSSFSKAWYLEEVLSSIPLSIASWEMLSGFCPARFGVYCSAVWCSAADTHIKLLDRVVSGASFLTAWGCV